MRHVLYTRLIMELLFARTVMSPIEPVLIQDRQTVSLVPVINFFRVISAMIIARKIFTI